MTVILGEVKDFKINGVPCTEHEYLKYSIEIERTANRYIREQYAIKELQCHKLGIALRHAAEIFQTYAQHHRDKGNVEKASANQAAADMCDRAVL